MSILDTVIEIVLHTEVGLCKIQVKSLFFGLLDYWIGLVNILLNGYISSGFLILRDPIIQYQIDINYSRPNWSIGSILRHFSVSTNHIYYCYFLGLVY